MVFSIIGDSNVKRNISKTNARACPQMSGAQFLQCGRLQLFEESLRSIRKESNVCIVSCVTNFLTSSEEEPMVSRRIEPILEEFCSVLSDACASMPGVSFLVAPPMYRKSPVWYREGLPEVLTRFSGFMRDKPATLHLLPSFATPEYDPDGIHLTPYSGLEFMIHLFDSSLSTLAALTSSCDERIPESIEATRVLEDRVMVLEQDHRRLNSVVELKTASDAELHDYHENIRNESFISITNCARISGQSTKEWQDRARKEVSPILKELMGREIPIDYISNATGPGRDAQVRYNVRLMSPDISKEVRTKFSSFYPKGRDERPPFFKDRDLSIRNLLTQGSRIRLAILQVIARRYRDSNQGSKAQALGFDPRPLLRIIPAQGSRVQTYNFVEAVQKFPTNFTKSDLDFILSKVGYKQKGQLRSLFVCLSDDMLTKFQRSNRPNPRENDQAPMDQDPAPASEVDPPQVPPSHPSGSGSVQSTSSTHSRSDSRSGSGSGQSTSSRSESGPEARQENRSESKSESRSSTSSRVNHKRGATSSPSHNLTPPEKTSRV